MDKCTTAIRTPFGRPAMIGCLVALTVAAAILAACATTADADDREEAPGQWKQLFNGKNLDGWTVKIRHADVGDNVGNTFRVEDGLMTVSYDQYDKFEERFGHIFYNTPYSHYRLRVEYRFIGEQLPDGPGWARRNSGIMLHGQSPQSMRKDQDFPSSLEVQLLGGDGTNKRPTANLCTPGTHVVMNDQLIKRHCTNSTSKTYHGDQWVTVEVEVRGNEVIRHIIDGQVVIEYNKPQLDENDPNSKPLIKDGKIMLDSGYISLQSESHPCQFRKVEIMVLEKQNQ